MGIMCIKYIREKLREADKWMWWQQRFMAQGHWDLLSTLYLWCVPTQRWIYDISLAIASAASCKRFPLVRFYCLFFICLILIRLFLSFPNSYCLIYSLLSRFLSSIFFQTWPLSLANHCIFHISLSCSLIFSRSITLWPVRSMPPLSNTHTLISSLLWENQSKPTELFLLSLLTLSKLCCFHEILILFY